MLGREFTDVLPKLKGHEILRRQEEAMTERKPVHFETLSPATGKWVELHFYPTNEGLTVHFRDVTERKKADEALRQSEERFRALISQATAGITQTDKDGKFMFVNERYCEIVGYSPDELLNMRMQDISDPEIVPANIELYKRIWTHGTPFVIEKQYIRKDGSRVWVNNSVAPVADADGKTEFVVCVTIDISKRKRVEQALRESEERLRLAIDISQTSTFDIDLLTDAVQTDEIGRDIYGWAPDEALTFSKVQSHFHPEDKEYVLQSVGAAFEPKGRGEFEVEQRIIRTDGETRWIRVHGRAFFDGGGKERQAVRCLGTYIDITERKQVEQEREKLLQLEHSARLQAEEASRLKDEFLATVSHELRTPLNAILGWSQMLTSGKFNEEYTTRALETIYRNAKSQAQLIEDILDVSRIITGKLRINAKPVSLSPIIQAVVESLRPSIEAKHIRLRMGLDFEPKKIYADPDRLQQVVWNLLSNAIKFTPEKGQITIELESDESETKVIVSDTGKGVSPEFLPFVFDRFRQADGTTTRQHGGLGLGLAVVRHIVELHGGTVDVKSKGEGKGTTFTVCLPLIETPSTNIEETNGHNLGAKQSNSDKSILSVKQSELKGKRILLIDDENDTLEMLAAVLDQNGAEVKAQTNVREALEAVKEWKPDVVISDIAMPEEDGYSFIRKLRALPPEEGGTIPAIALTAYVGIKERTKVLSSGFQMYVPKPVEPLELLSTLISLV
jgi:PAS domain S-box-containing protein